MSFSDEANPNVLPALADVLEESYWMDDEDWPDEKSRLVGENSADLLIVGGGFTGLWAAIEAKESNPNLDVALVEGKWIAHGASGRNGGFVAASLTHGFSNGLNRWPDELAQLTKLGQENLDAIEKFVRTEGIDCDWRRVGEIDVATEEYQVEELIEFGQLAKEYGEEFTWLNQTEVKAKLNSPTYLGGLYNPDGVALVDPARLAWGLRDSALKRGVRIYENTMVNELEDKKHKVRAVTDLGAISAPKVLLATNAFPPLIRRLKYLMVPVYDSVLVTEPLNQEQRASIGWDEYQGISDSGNQFHYYRPTEDGSILWGGYDATYNWRSGFGADYERTVDSWVKIGNHFFETFPQLEGIKFSHAWSGAIDTSTRFSAFWGQTMGKKLAYVAGYTGLGVGASRFGAQVAIDLLFDRDSDRRKLTMVNSKPIPFPPEPFRSAGINFTRWSLDKADRNQGKRNLWLRGLDRIGMGFDS
jgi:glycine/D-amino acid oxidase-like deaminating enzyme